MNDWDKILGDFARKCKGGAPDMTNPRHLALLRESLIKFGWNENATNAFIGNLREGKEIVTEDNPGVFFGYTKKNKKRYFPDAGKLAAAIKRGSVTPAPNMDKDDPEWTRTAKTSKRADKYKKSGKTQTQSDAIQDKIKLNKRLLKMTPEEREKEVGKISSKERISNLKARTEFDEMAKEEEKRIKKLEKFQETLEKGLETADEQEEILILTTLAFLYEGRDNAGIGKNMLGHNDIDLLHKNRKRLEKLYDDAIPEEVEKGVREVRHREVSEETIRASWDALPVAVQNALKGKGKTGKSGENLHCRGYLAINPNDPVHTSGKKKGQPKYYTTSDRDDSNIQKEKDGSPMVDRGKVPSTDRGRLVWRMYLEQGGRDAYTGEPLDLESMDLEHVVGFQNKDQCTPAQITAKTCPSEEDYKNREHEANQVLTSSRANQNKKDKNMKQFLEDDVDKHMDGDKPKSEEYFKKKKEGYDDINRRVTIEEQTALRLQGDVQYKLKGGRTTRDMHDENVEISELGTPEVASSTLGDNVTTEVLTEEIDRAESEIKNIQKQLLSQPNVTEEDKKSIKAVGSKIGKKLVNAMGLTRYVQDPSGRRATSISGTDGYFRGFAMTMAGTPVQDRQKLRQKWEDSIKDASNSEVLDAGMANEVMTASLIKRGALDEDNLVKYAGAYGLNPSGNETKTKAGWKKDDKGNLIIIYNGKEYKPKDYAQVKIDEVNKKLGTSI